MMYYRVRWLDRDVTLDAYEAEGLIETLEMDGYVPRVEVLRANNDDSSSKGQSGTGGLYAFGSVDHGGNR